MKILYYIYLVIIIFNFYNCSTSNNLNSHSHSIIKINSFKPESEQSILTLELQNYLLAEKEEEVYFFGFQITDDTYFLNNLSYDKFNFSKYSGVTLRAINKMLDKWNLDSIHIVKVTETTESFLFPLFWKNSTVVEVYPIKLKTNSSIKLKKKE